ncbi:M48 family metallopeptidase [Brumimicrobium sp.]|uniref:M48 family metallopeptidase n=1 Tax=Brumimicrobium sp. TaxID=2029867 RepID=UPI003A922819
MRHLYLFLFVLPFTIYSQETDFNNFKTTKAVGEPPSIFTASFQERVEDRKGKITEVSDEHIDNYAMRTTYSLNNILKTGYVLYGDPMTLYIQKIAANLLKNEPSLKDELQFYVIKNNITNALCTDPGVIFITTGLIAQVENEAQLAYIIAHEIVHYQEKHIQKSFTFANETDYDARSSYQEMVVLSKEHEFEADVKALKLYHAAGYSEKEINTVFDVLMYSYLTFDEIEIDSTFFEDPNTYIPRSYFPEKANPILAFEDYDDSKSTHPNIRKRKDAIAAELRKYDHWKDNKNFISLEEFNHVQNIARFETLRENVILANYLEALYEVYILEKQFPNNTYLQTMKAVVWSKMNQTSLSGKKNTFLKNAKEKEGSISVLYELFKNFSRKELAILTVRQLEDIHQNNPTSEYIEELRNETFKSLAHLRRFEINRLEKISFNDALELRENVDTTTISDTVDIEGETKYDRIRRIRAAQSSSQSLAELVDENFADFLLHDLVANRTFNDLYEEEKKSIEEAKKEEEEEEIKKKKGPELEGDIILLNPYLIASHRTRGFDLENTLTFHSMISESFEEQIAGRELHNISVAYSNQFTTERYNEASILTDYVLQIVQSENTDFKFINVDREELSDIVSLHNNPYLLLISGRAKRLSRTKNSLTANIQYIELATGKVVDQSYYSVGLKIRKASVGGLVFQALSKF